MMIQTGEARTETADPVFGRRLVARLLN